MAYRAVFIDPRMTLMSLPVLRKLNELVAAGVTVIGAKPQASPSLTDDQKEFSTLADATFGSGPARAWPSDALAGALNSAITPDVDDHDAGLKFVHRRLKGGEIYFISNPQDPPKSVDVSFRTTGHAVEIWRADTGQMQATSYRVESGRTVVPLALTPHGALFVVFRGAGGAERISPSEVGTKLSTLTGPWRLQFPADQVTHGDIPAPPLGSWSLSDDPDVRYFSGTACYHTSFKAPAVKAGRLILDLGEVRDIAAVSINGQSVGEAWNAPYKVDISSAVHAGANTADICVANLWPNRLIDDHQPEAKRPPVFTTFNPFPPTTPLRPSGLLGPVALDVVTP